jgi:exopolysaccharide biosynthesis polyprenyl glycosylphosphotransferase
MTRGVVVNIKAGDATVRATRPAFDPLGANSEGAHGLDAKRLADIVLAGLAIILFGPILAVAAIAIALDTRGPILFCQRRTGLNGRPFGIYKFRTMTVMEDGATVTQAVAGDARITRVGRFLRASSIDELPQLFNVLKGDMSLVGPRPHAVAHDGYYGARIANYGRRFAVRPGITGWAQVKGARGATPTIADMQARVDLDVWYVEHAGLGLDLLILVRTPLEVLRHRNAV